MAAFRTTSISFGLAFIICLASFPASAGTMIGEITKVEKSTISIEGSTYRIEQSALVGKGPSKRTSLKLDNLAVGQIVTFTHVKDRVTKLEILHGETEVPN